LARVEKLRRTLNQVLTRFNGDGGARLLVEKLLDYNAKSPQGVLHTVIQLLVAVKLLEKGYRVEVEYKLPQNLVCDIYAWKGTHTLIVEVETGYTPPAYATTPRSYLRARIALKALKYYRYADKLVLAVPEHYNPPIPHQLVEPPERRDVTRLEELINEVRKYNPNTKTTINDALKARIHALMIVDVDNCRIRIRKPKTPKP